MERVGYQRKTQLPEEWKQQRVKQFFKTFSKMRSSFVEQQAAASRLTEWHSIFTNIQCKEVPKIQETFAMETSAQNLNFFNSKHNTGDSLFAGGMLVVVVVGTSWSTATSPVASSWCFWAPCFLSFAAHATRSIDVQTNLTQTGKLGKRDKSNKYLDPGLIEIPTRNSLSWETANLSGVEGVSHA